MTAHTSTGRLLLQALRELPRFVHDWIGRKLDQQVRSMHSPFRVAEHELICRSCRNERWPCAALREYEQTSMIVPPGAASGADLDLPALNETPKPSGG